MIDERKLIEDIEDVFCNDCVKCNGSCRFSEIAEIIRQQPKIIRLVPVSYRFPEINGQYLCQIGPLKNAYFDVLCFSDDLYSVDEYDFRKYKGKKKKSGFYDYDSEWGYFEVRGVVAWMPLPEPYKEEGAG